MASEWGMGIRVRRGLRIVQRQTAKGLVWYREDRQGGRPVRVSLETSDEKEALRKAVLGPEGPSPRPFLSSKSMTKTSILTLGNALEEYEEWYRKNHVPGEAGRIGALLGTFVGPLGEGLDTRAVTRDHVQGFVDLRSDGRAPATVRKDFARLRAFLNWIVKRKEAANPNACRGIDLPKDEGVTREVLAPEKVRAILARLHTHPWLGDYYRLLLETGMRPSELLGLRGVDVRGRLVTVTPWGTHRLKNKWSRRVIEVNDSAARILKRRGEAMFQKTLPLFGNSFGQVRNENSVYRLLCDTLAGKRRAPVPGNLKCTLYDARHYFATRCAAPGPSHWPIERTAAYLGHAPNSNTLMKFYVDQNALRQGAPPAIIEEKAGKVVRMRRAEK